MSTRRTALRVAGRVARAALIFVAVTVGSISLGAVTFLVTIVSLAAIR